MKDVDPLLGQFGDDLLVVDRVAFLNHPVFLGVDCIQLFLGSQSRGVRRGNVGRGQLMQRGHPDHEEFVNVTLGDSQEVGPFQQRVIDIRCFAEDPAVEVNPAELPVHIIFWFVKILIHN